MLEHAKNLEFEQAAAIRDEIQRIKELGAAEGKVAGKRASRASTRE
jgi:excinuclease UvrABC nuclease subunit